MRKLMKNKAIVFFLLCAAGVLPVFYACAARADGVIAITTSNNQATINVNLPNVSPHKVFIVPNPERLVVDVPAVAQKPAVGLPVDYKGTLIHAVRFGQFSPDTYRFVFDLTLPVVIAHTEEDKGHKRLSITIAPTGATSRGPAAEAEGKPAAIEAASPKAQETPEDKHVMTVPAKAAKQKMAASDDEADEFADNDGEETGTLKNKSGKQQKAVAQSSGSDSSLKDSEGSAKKDKKGLITAKNQDESKFKKKNRQKPLIIIDPGHGGVDPGTTGPNGVNEKDVVLQFAKALKARLLKSGHYRVELTRETDEFIMLRQRVKIARDKKADLFISMHADSAPEAAARGLSVYTLSEKSSDEEAAALAARENKSDVLAGMDLSEERQDVADILISLAQRDTANRSSQLADLLVYSLDGKVRLLSNSHRFAGFAVLKAPDIPSALIELGFLSHPQEEKQLKTASYRQTVVDGIASGVESYFTQNQGAGDQ